MDFTLKEFETINLYSNKNVESILKNVVDTSSNAVLINVFEDSVILLDHEEGQFYTADYNFDPQKATIRFENFEPVELRKEADDLRDKICDFFDDEEDEITALDLTESYKNSVMKQERYVNELIKNAVATKDFTDIIDYSKIVEVKEEVSIEDEPFFESYKERLETHPLTEVKLFNWDNPVNVSLVETERVKLINSDVAEKANNLWKRSGFKEKFEESALAFVDDVEEGTEKFKELLEQFPQIFFLDNADRKTLFGKSIMNSSILREHMDDLIKGINLLFEKFDLADMRKEYLESIQEQEEEEEELEEPKKEPKEKKDKEPAEELGPEDLDKIVAELKKIAEKVENEKAKEKLDSLIEKLEKGKEEGTRPEEVKEAVAILSL